MTYSPALTDAQLRSAPLTVSGTVGISGTVSGTFFQATQPVSIASMPSTPVTGTFWQATQPVSGTVTVGNASLAVTGTFFQATQPVSIASMPSTPVTGTFWQATQPVSGTVAVSNFPASQAVTGTFFQATQPISAASLPLPAGASTETTLAALNTKVTAVNTGAVTISAALPTGANTIGTTTGPTLTKATQGTTGYSVQDLKDAGRVSYAASTVIAGVTAVTAEALLSMVPVRDGVAAAATTSLSVTANKRFRVEAIYVTGLTTAAAVLSARISLRMNPSGAATAASPIIATVGLNGPAAVALTGDSAIIPIPDGFEISGTNQIGLSQVAAAITGTIRASIIGFEY